MPLFEIETTKRSSQTWKFHVTADTEEEAIAIALSGEVDPVDYSCTGDEDAEEVFESSKIIEP